MNQPLYFIADIGANHDGDLNRAYKLIELAKNAGAEIVAVHDIKIEAAEAAQTIRSLNKESGMIPFETRVCTRTNSASINPPQSKSMSTVVEFQAYSRPFSAS